MAFIIHNKCALPKQADEVVETSFAAVHKIGDPNSRAQNESASCWMKGFLTEVKAMDRILSKLPIESMQNFGTGAKLKFYLTGFISGTLLDFRRDLKNAAEQSLRGAELSEETDFYENQVLLYANLAREFASLGQMKQADLYFDKMEKIFRETTVSGFVFATVIHLLTKGMYYASKHQWEQSNQAYEEAIKYYLSFSPPTGIMAGIRRGYGWSLLQQGRFDDAKKQFEESKKTMDELESRLVHSNIYGFILAPTKTQTGKQFNIRLDVINVAKNSASLVNIKDLLPPEFRVISSEPNLHIENGSIYLSQETINPFQDKPIILTVEATKPGNFNINPEISYVDDLQQNKSTRPQAVKINVQPPKPDYQVLPGRASTGTTELDRLLLGGIPEKYSAILVTPSCEEKQQIIKRFLETGVGNGENTIYLTCEATNVEELSQTFPNNFYAIACNPQAESALQNVSTVFKLKGTENLTDIDIALTKILRSVNKAQNLPKRICIDLLSDVLLQHHAITTRKWLSALLLDLKSKGFTTLATIDPAMHPADEAQAVLSLFNGEIRLTEKEDKSQQKYLRITKLLNQNYLKDEIIM
jgi:KaiC/GvpD/RAD55 family RecA-like ATPase